MSWRIPCLSFPRSVGDRYGCASSELGRVSGVCLSTLVDDTTGSKEAPIISWGPHAPFWPQRPWFPDLLELVVDGQISLLQCRNLLSQPRFHCHHLGIDYPAICSIPGIFLSSSEATWFCSANFFAGSISGQVIGL